MKLVWLFAILVLATPSVASPVSDTENLFQPRELGIRLFPPEHFYTLQDLSRTTNLLKFEEFSPADYAYKGILLAAEIASFHFIASRLAIFKKTNLGRKYLNTALRDVGVTIQGRYLLNRISSPKLMASARYQQYIASHETLLSVFTGMFIKRPTPGGLRAAVRQAILFTLEDYAYALSNGVPPDDPHLQAAAAHIRNAIGEYKTYTGLLDAASMTYTSYSPEGFNSVMSECVLAIDEIQLSLGRKPSAKYLAMMTK